MTFKPMADLIPEGKVGQARIRHLVIEDVEARYTRLRALITGSPNEGISKGYYCQLLVGSTLMMSDTGMERKTNREVVRKAQGHVLISGLGIGMILVPILSKPEVTKVTVVEKYQDVIDLVGPNFPDPKLEIIYADVHDFKPPKGTKYNVIYHDIWPWQSTDTLKEMTTLHRRFARYLVPGGWQDSWRKKELLARKKRENKQDRKLRCAWF